MKIFVAVRDFQPIFHSELFIDLTFSTLKAFGEKVNFKWGREENLIDWQAENYHVIKAS